MFVVFSLLHCHRNSSTLAPLTMAPPNVSSLIQHIERNQNLTDAQSQSTSLSQNHGISRSHTHPPVVIKAGSASPATTNRDMLRHSSASAEMTTHSLVHTSVPTSEHSYHSELTRIEEEETEKATQHQDGEHPISNQALATSTSSSDKISPGIRTRNTSPGRYAAKTAPASLSSHTRDIVPGATPSSYSTPATPCPHPVESKTPSPPQTPLQASENPNNSVKSSPQHTHPASTSPSLHLLSTTSLPHDPRPDTELSYLKPVSPSPFSTPYGIPNTQPYAPHLHCIPGSKLETMLRRTRWGSKEKKAATDEASTSSLASPADDGVPERKGAGPVKKKKRRRRRGRPGEDEASIEGSSSESESGSGSSSNSSGKLELGRKTRPRKKIVRKRGRNIPTGSEERRTRRLRHHHHHHHHQYHNHDYNHQRQKQHHHSKNNKNKKKKSRTCKWYKLPFCKCCKWSVIPVPSTSTTSIWKSATLEYARRSSFADTKFPVLSSPPSASTFSHGNGLARSDAVAGFRNRGRGRHGRAGRACAGHGRAAAAAAASAASASPVGRACESATATATAAAVVYPGQKEEEDDDKKERWWRRRRRLWGSKDV